MYEMFELQARYDARKSFYGKAKVVVEGNILSLYSYDTLVAVIIDGKVTRADIGVHSMTTNRHIREFVKQFSIDGVIPKEV